MGKMGHTARSGVFVFGKNRGCDASFYELCVERKHIKYQLWLFLNVRIMVVFLSFFGGTRDWTYHWTTFTSPFHFFNLSWSLVKLLRLTLNLELSCLSFLSNCIGRHAPLHPSSFFFKIVIKIYSKMTTKLFSSPLEYEYQRPEMFPFLPRCYIPKD